MQEKLFFKEKLTSKNMLKRLCESCIEVFMYEIYILMQTKRVSAVYH